MISERLLTAVFRRTLGRAMRLEDFSAGRIPAVVAEHHRPLLYLHIPFCRSLCPFCTFHRVRFTPGKTHAYFRALRDEVRLHHEAGFRHHELYVGGGTPTVDPDELIRTLDLVRQLHDIRHVSVETNPSELTPALVSRLVAAGVNRLSVGVQSFDDDLLRSMGRYDAYGSAREIIAHLARANDRFDTVNIDLIFNLPGQGEDSLKRDLEIVTGEVGADQVSWYPLMAGDHALRAMRQVMGGGPAGNERRHYDLILDHMLPRYQASTGWCFSRDAAQIDEYIVEERDYLGLGSGAFSYLDGTLYSNTFSINAYRRRLGAGVPAVTAHRRLTPDEQLRYDFLMGLFATRLETAQLAARHGQGWRTRLRWPIVALKLMGAVTDEGTELRLTRSGMYLWIVMMREFFNGVNALRDDMRAHIRQERRQFAPIRMERGGRPGPLEDG